MKAVTPEEAVKLVREAQDLSRDEIAGLQKDRLNALVAFARSNSKFYMEKYEGLPAHPSLEMLPMVNKQELTSRMQDWVTDPDFSVEALESFIEEEGVGNLFMDKYSVSTTSGTTGEPLRMMRDSRHVTINGALLQERLYNGPLLKEMPDLTGKMTKFASVLATGGHHAASTGFEKRRAALAAEGITGTMELLSIGEPVSDMVQRLNAFQPEVVTGYPSVLHILAGEQKEGRLRINPNAVLCSAEQLTDDARKLMEEQFDCPVGNVFCSTEGGEVALLCDHGHMHLNPDWIIVEPIDRVGNPVVPGTMSEGVLVTNLANAVQPIIRYHVDDCVILHDEPCACGLPFPYIDILGRSNDIPEFEGKDGTVRLSSVGFLAAALDVEGISIYQFIQNSPKELTVRITYHETADHKEVDRRAREVVTKLLTANGLHDITLHIVEGEPVRAKKGKKMKAYLKDY